MSDPTPPEAEVPLHLQIDRETGPDEVVLTLRGELDIASAPTLERAVEAARSANSARLIIDLAGVTFMDSTGLRVLLLARESIDGNGRELRLRPGPRQVQRVFELSGTLDAFAFEE